MDKLYAHEIKALADFTTGGAKNFPAEAESAENAIHTMNELGMLDIDKARDKICHSSTKVDTYTLHCELRKGHSERHGHVLNPDINLEVSWSDDPKQPGNQ